MVVGMNLEAGHRYSLAAVAGHMDRHIHGVYAIEDERVGIDLAVVFGILHHVVAHLGPMPAAVFGTVESGHLVTARGGYGGVDHVGFLRRDRQRNAAGIDGRQSLGQLLPMRACVGALVDRRFGTARDDDAGVAPALIGGSVYDIGIARVDIEVGDAGILADLQDGLPGLAPVGGFVKTAIAARREERPLRGHQNHVRIARIDPDFRDVLGVRQSHHFPGLAPVGALVNAVAIAYGPLALILTGAQPHDVGVLGVHGHAPEGVGSAVVEDGLPGDSVVGGFPKASRGCGDIPDAAIFRVDRDVGDAAGTEGSGDVPDFETADDLGIQARRWRLPGDQAERKESSGDQTEEGALHEGYRTVYARRRWERVMMRGRRVNCLSSDYLH